MNFGVCRGGNMQLLQRSWMGFLSRMSSLFNTLTQFGHVVGKRVSVRSCQVSLQFMPSGFPLNPCAKCSIVTLSRKMFSS